MIDVNEILFRASANGDLMTNSRDAITDKQLQTIQELQEKRKTKPLTLNQENELDRLLEKKKASESGVLSETCIKRLIKVWAEYAYGRTEEITSKYMEKGTTVEEDSLTLLSRVFRKNFTKNTERFSNRIVTGLPDIIETNDLEEEEVRDVKSTWSLITFLNAKVDKKMNHDYKWQGNTYLGLRLKAKRFKLNYCLVNTPGDLITNEKYNLRRNMGFLDPTMADEDPTYVEKCQQIERNHIFELDLFKSHFPGFDFHTDLNTWRWDIPKEKRVHEMVFARNEAEISALYNQGIQCRGWIKKTFIDDEPTGLLT